MKLMGSTQLQSDAVDANIAGYKNYEKVLEDVAGGYQVAADY